jgi:hypothetical protein
MAIYRRVAVTSPFFSIALSQNAPCGVSTRQKNSHLRSVNAGFSSSRSLPDTFCNSPQILAQPQAQSPMRHGLPPRFEIPVSFWSGCIRGACGRSPCMTLLSRADYGPMKTSLRFTLGCGKTKFLLI